LLIGTFPPALQLVEAYTYSFPKRALVSCIRCFGQEDRWIRQTPAALQADTDLVDL